MSIANVLKSINAPILGKVLYRTEDQFIHSSYLSENMAALTDTTAMSMGGNSDSYVDNVFATKGNQRGYSQQIIISCKGKKRRVTGYLYEGVKINGVSEWEDITNTAGISSLNKGMSTINKLGQLGFAANKDKSSTAGSVLQQPWLDRKFWKHSKPFTLNFNINFVAQTSPRDEVFLPAQTLLSFCYPREVDNVDMVNQSKEGLSLLSGSETKNTQGTDNLVTAATKTIKTFAIPGPSLMYGSSKDSDGLAVQSDNGDAVTIVIGNMFAFGACYLKQVNLEFSPNADCFGYPTWCKCSIEAEAMDSNYCDKNGNFNISQWANSANDISGLVEASRVTVTDAALNAANIAKATVNAIGAFPQIFKD